LDCVDPRFLSWNRQANSRRLYDVLATWKERAANMKGKGLPGGHSLQETTPGHTLAELRAFLRS
jgi:haloacetate dehalogenase